MKIEFEQLPNYISGLPAEQPWRDRALNAWKEWQERTIHAPVPRLDVFGPRSTDQQRADAREYDEGQRRKARGY